MLEFIDGATANDILGKKDFGAIYLGGPTEDPKESEAFKTLQRHFPGIENSFNPPEEIRHEGKTYLCEFNGTKIYFGFIKKVDRFQASLINILVTLRETQTDLLRNKSNDLLMFPFAEKAVKIHKSIMVPVLADEIIASGIRTKWINNEYAAVSNIKTIESRQELDIIENSWESNWYLNEDDLMFVFGLLDLAVLQRGNKLSKSSLSTLFKVAHDTGMVYKDFEYVEGDFGPWCKKVPMKIGMLLNHGFLIDADHFTGGKRTDFREGPSMRLLDRIARKFWNANRTTIRQFAESMMRGLIAHRIEMRKKQQEEQKQGGGAGGGNGFGGGGYSGGGGGNGGW